MRKPVWILVLGIALAIGAFATFYYAGTASSRDLMRQPQPELAWLKKEFNLSEEEYVRIVNLHQAYLPQCAERCRLIEEQNQKLQKLLAGHSEMTPEIEAAMAQRAKMRSDCEAEMLKHFLEVSKTMPPEQGRRYLAWVERQTFMRGEAMEQQHHDGHTHSHQEH